MLGATILQRATRALRTPLARPCLCRPSLLPSSSSPTLRLLSSSAPALSPLLASSTAPSLLQRAASPAAAPVGQTRAFRTPKSMKRKASPVARNGGAGKTARKHSARAAKRRRQRAKKIN